MDRTRLPSGAQLYRLFVGAILTLALAGILTMIVLASHGSIDVFSPVGAIGRQERNLIIFASVLALIVVIPVFALTFLIAWRYRETNSKAAYTPEWDHSRVIESIWWGIPIALIGLLAVVAWNSSHSLDPNRSVAAAGKPVTIQAVALQWRWLFLYPDEGVASLNYVRFPAGTPVHFEITADAPMNSFWIPKLGGQIYAMAGMSTNLNLIADQPGNYRGSSANISGQGFANMHFIAEATSQNDYRSWLRAARASSPLTADGYKQLAKPSSDSTQAAYQLTDAHLYADVIHSYMHSTGGSK